VFLGAFDVFGIWVSTVGFGGVVWVGMWAGLGVVGGFRSLWAFWVLFCGVARLFLCILPMYFGAPYAF